MDKNGETKKKLMQGKIFFRQFTDEVASCYLIYMKIIDRHFQ